MSKLKECRSAKESHDGDFASQPSCSFSRSWLCWAWPHADRRAAAVSVADRLPPAAAVVGYLCGAVPQDVEGWIVALAQAFTALHVHCEAARVQKRLERGRWQAFTCAVHGASVGRRQVRHGGRCSIKRLARFYSWERQLVIPIVSAVAGTVCVGTMRFPSL